MKLDANILRYLSREDFRVLTAVEMGMKNHEIVPTELVVRIAAVRHGGAKRMLSTLLRHKLLHHENRQYDGYRLTYSGYDYLALKTLSKRDTIGAIGYQIGIGKESDVYVVSSPDGEELAMKFHRLGRVSFRQIKNKRDYLRKNQSASNWLYLSRLAALKEYAFMKALYNEGFPVPTPIDWNRHCVVMSYLKDCTLMNNISELGNPEKVYDQCMELIVRLASYGLVHGDFNEFNLLVSEEEDVIIIDFPQMISTSHLNAKEQFDRDVECICRFFKKRFHFVSDNVPDFDTDISRTVDLDVQLAASGFTKEQAEEFEQLTAQQEGDDDAEDDDNASGDEEEEAEDSEDSASDSGSDDEGDEDGDEGDAVDSLAEEVDGVAVSAEGDEGAGEEGEEEEEGGSSDSMRAVRNRVKRKLKKQNMRKRIPIRNSTKSRGKREAAAAIRDRVW